jgi:hypothetical protein
VVHTLNFVVNIAARGLYHHLIALTLTYQSPRNRRAHRDEIGLNIGFVLTHNSVSNRVIVFCINKINRRPKNNFSGIGDRTNVNDLSVRKFVFDILNTALGKALLLPSRMILSIFFEIAVLTGLRMACIILGRSSRLSRSSSCLNDCSPATVMGTLFMK